MNMEKVKNKICEHIEQWGLECEHGRSNILTYFYFSSEPVAKAYTNK